MSDLINESYKALHPSGPDIEIRIKPFEKSSFLFDFLLEFSKVAPIILVSLGPDAINKIMETLRHLGFIYDEGVSLLKLMKTLGGEPKSVIDQGDGNFNYISENGDQTIVNGNVHTLIQNPIIKNEIKNTVSYPFKDSRVEKIDSYIKNQKEKTKIEISRDDAGKLKTFDSQETDLDEKPLESESEILLHPKRADLEGDGKKWSFREPGGAVIVASIKDKNFLEDVANGKIALGHNDLLKVRLLKKQQVVTGKGGTTTNEILRVIKYTKGANRPEQTSFLDD